MPERPPALTSAPAMGLDPARVCTLPPAELGARLAWIRGSLLPHAVLREPLEGGVAFEFTAADGLPEALDELVRLEADCCAGIGFAHVPSRDPGHRRLEIHGVDPAAPWLAAPLPVPDGRGRLVRALVAGTLGSLVVCCALPLAAGAVVGAAAAPLLALDAPVPIALGAALGSALAWRRAGRRRAATPCGPGC